MGPLWASRSETRKAGEMAGFRNWIVFWKCGGRDKTNYISLMWGGGGGHAFQPGAHLAAHPLLTCTVDVGTAVQTRGSVHTQC